MTSPQLNKPRRTLSEAKRQVYMARLKGLAVHYRCIEAQKENGSATSWRHAGYYREQAEALEWAMDELDKPHD